MVLTFILVTVRLADHREDFRDRWNCKLKPAHRLAFRDYREMGLVLPFGAPKLTFNTPNPTLFDEDGIWLQEDFMFPINGWEYVICPLFKPTY